MGVGEPESETVTDGLGVLVGVRLGEGLGVGVLLGEGVCDGEDVKVEEAAGCVSVGIAGTLFETGAPQAVSASRTPT